MLDMTATFELDDYVNSIAPEDCEKKFYLVESIDTYDAGTRFACLPLHEDTLWINMKSGGTQISGRDYFNRTAKVLRELNPTEVVKIRNTK